MQVKNWCYGAFRATELADEIEDQIRLGHRYRNRLCELELERRAAVQDTINEMCDGYVAACNAVTQAEEAIENIYANVKRRRQRDRTRGGLTGAESEQVAKLKASLKGLRQQRKQAKTAAFARTDVKAALDQTSAEHREQCRQARKDSGLYWGTYLTVEDACKTFGRGSPPRFERWTGEGKIAVQLQHGLTADDAINGQDTRLRLLVPDSGRNAELMIRIGSEGRAPIFARVPFIMHRPLPDKSTIKWAYLEKRRIASDTYWQLRLSIEFPNEVRAPKKPEEVVVVHVGWRKIGHDIRVATILGSDGFRDTVLVDRVDSFMLPDRLQGYRDQHFNEIKPALLKWINGLDEVPELLQPVSQIRSEARLAKIVTVWRDSRLPGDAEIFDRAEQWRKKDKHLWNWQSHQRVKVRRWRKDMYRNIARRLADRYGFVSIVAAPWAALREKPQVDEEENQTTYMRHLSAIAAVAELEKCIEEAFGRDCVIDVDPAHISTDCHSCGHRNKVGSRQYVNCQSCGRRWDVDNNGSSNQLARALVELKSMPSLASVMAERVRSDSEPLKVSDRQSKFRTSRETARKAKVGKAI